MSTPPPETLGMTTAKHWATGTGSNLERALKIGDELGGHIVAGHADGIATHRQARRSARNMARSSCDDAGTGALIAAKGFGDAGRRVADREYLDDVVFSVLIIPHTLNVPRWRLARGDRGHLEVDLMARYARGCEMK